MRRRLLIANVVLVALAASGVWRFRAEFRRARERYRVLNPAAAPTLKTQPAEPPPLPPIQPAAYLDAAEKFLFSPDRNPTVVVEPPKVKPRPTLPQLFGVMNLGSGPIAIMAEKANAPHKTVRVGETIGEFKLLGAAGDEITLEWEGQPIHAQVSDVLVRPAADSTANTPAVAVAGGPAGAGGSGSGGATVMNPNANSRPGEYLIGPPMQGAQGTIYQSPPGDTAPDGTVYQGKRKVVRQTPFGAQSWWEDVK